MHKVLRSLCGIIVAVFMATSLICAGDKFITISTTTSTQASGLLDVLLPEFTKDTGIKVKVIAKGTGAAIRDGMDGNVDVIFVHARFREEKFIADGFGTKRYAIMHNDFVILGPPSDPAGVRDTSDVASALSLIAKNHKKFVSRGDDSGTHTKEQFLWRATGLRLKQTISTIIQKGKKKQVKYSAPEGSWYHSLGQGMGKVITYADEKQAYTLADRGTYVKYKHGRSQGIDLEVLFEGDMSLRNPYGVIPVNPQKHPHVKFDMARRYAEWLISKKAQTMIANYKLVGKQLFYPDAMNGYSE